MIPTMTTDNPSSPIEVPSDALVLLIGAAGSGKSTLAARFFPADAILSSDALRTEISGDPANQAVNQVIFRLLHERAEQRLAAGRLTVIDATNVAAYARRPLRRLAARYGRPAFGLVLHLPAALCLARNAARTGRIVPQPAVERQLAALDNALGRGELGAEGLARLIVLTSPAEVDRLSIRLTKRLTKRAGAVTLSASAFASPDRRRKP